MEVLHLPPYVEKLLRSTNAVVYEMTAEFERIRDERGELIEVVTLINVPGEKDNPRYRIMRDRETALVESLDGETLCGEVIEHLRCVSRLSSIDIATLPPAPEYEPLKEPAFHDVLLVANNATKTSRKRPAKAPAKAPTMVSAAGPVSTMSMDERIAYVMDSRWFPQNGKGGVSVKTVMDELKLKNKEITRLFQAMVERTLAVKVLINGSEYYARVAEDPMECDT
jgi:hypothetical protein